MKGAFRLLRTFCPSHLLEEIEGDLLQRYERDLNPSDRFSLSYFAATTNSVNSLKNERILYR